MVFFAIPECPRCGRRRIWKDGKRKKQHAQIQRFICRECGYRFSGSQVLSIGNKQSSKRQVCVTADGAKNLIVAKEEALATGDKSTKNSLFPYTWYLRKQGYAVSTIESRTQILSTLLKRGADLSNPESVKEIIAIQTWVPKRKMNAVDAYSVYLRMSGGTWNPPHYKDVRKPIALPKESEIDALISGTGLKTSVLLQLLKETGARVGEALQLEWGDIDFDTRIIRITPEKRSNPRIFKVSSKLVNRLAYVKTVNKVENPNRVFANRYKTVLRVYLKQRKRIARNLQNERINRIKFHTIRHWYGTKVYHETKDIIFVQQRLGHRSIQNTMKYIHLAGAYFQQEDDEYVTKVASNVTEAIPLIEAGFVEASDFDGVKIYKIPKSRVEPVD